MVMTCVIPIEDMQYVTTFHLAKCTIYHFSSVEAYLLWKCCWVLQFLWNNYDYELTDLWKINALNI